MKCFIALKRIGDTEKIVSWKSKGLLTEKFTTPTTTDNNLSPTIKWHENSKFCLTFKGTCLKQRNATYTPHNRINFFIVCEWNSWPRDLDSGYDIGFNTRMEFSLPDGSVGKNVIIFGVNISSFEHIDNKGKDILILGEGPTQGLDDTTLTGETQYSINFTRPNIKFCSSLHYNGSFLFIC